MDRVQPPHTNEDWRYSNTRSIRVLFLVAPPLFAPLPLAAGVARRSMMSLRASICLFPYSLSSASTVVQMILCS
ncbi:hypothetical protein VIGAN_05127700 [Vigna angularis var. angularis]|uniref:Uncharacterized protein n=1 Tax=Vigna angularis var. angularis TaxID=157739 RepID=A0A0S3S4W1_PHAAN|nr:hypothetical protein VIGAN_05127700 [Vigna angularis var. angularis]